VERYEELYQDAIRLFTDFRVSTGALAVQVSKRDFVRELRVTEATAGLLLPMDAFTAARYLLPLIVANGKDIEIMGQITKWISRFRAEDKVPSGPIDDSTR
jgi:hypothetical protein